MSFISISARPTGTSGVSYFGDDKEARLGHHRTGEAFYETAGDPQGHGMCSSGKGVRVAAAPVNREHHSPDSQHPQGTELSCPLSVCEPRPPTSGQGTMRSMLGTQSQTSVQHRKPVRSQVRWTRIGEVVAWDSLEIWQEVQL